MWAKVVIPVGTKTIIRKSLPTATFRLAFLNVHVNLDGT